MSRFPRWRLGLRDVLILSAPLLLVLAYLSGAAVVDFQRAQQFDDYWGREVTVESRFLARAGALFRLLPEQRLQQRLSASRDPAGWVQLQVDPAALDATFRDPELGWDTWLEGDLVEDGRILPVHLRKRGDNSVHWLTEKKSLSLRTRREEFFKRYRSFGLSAKDVLTAYVANRLPQEFGLLAPSTTVVPVLLNHRYAGMYRFIEVVDESFLRPLERMPGNIFRGDAAERGEVFKGVPRDLFGDPYIWDRVAVSDRPTGAGAGQLRLFIEDVNGGDFTTHQRLMARIDRDEIARLVAFMLLVGDPYHMDGVHNQLWYEDPSTALLHPIPWDIRLLPLDQAPREELNAFLRAVLRDPWLIDAVLTELKVRLANQAWLRLGDSLARTAWNRYHDEFAYDSLRARLIPPLGSPDEVHRVLEDNLKVLRGWLADARVGFAGSSVIDLETRGFAGADLVGLDFTGLGAGTVQVRLDRNRNGRLDPDDPRLAGTWDGSRFTPARPLRLFAAWTASTWRSGHSGLAPGTQDYRLFLEGAPASVQVIPRLVNHYTGAPVTGQPWKQGDAIAASASFHPWQYTEMPGRLHRLSGAVHLTADLRIPVGDTLLIEPGTTIRMDPDVSVVSRGLVMAAGTAARPIIVTRADPARPWGTFALQGSGADSSRFSYVTFEWGGGALVDRVEYIGMVNLHRVHGVTVEHAMFRDNLRSDDTFHAMHSDLTLRDSHFVRANSDALDLDISTGVIEGNSFEDSGGDAIDLMTSGPLIRGNQIRNSGDKGISVGEASRPFIVGNRIEGCRRGIEVKDRSEPIVLDNRLSGNGVAIYEDRKNWRYGGGGWATVLGTPLAGNPDSLRLDDFSRITLSTDSTLAAVVVRAPLASVRFEEDFLSPADGWRGTGGVTRLAKSEQTLFAAVERQSGMLGRKVAWDLRQAGGPATLLLQAAARGLDSAEVTVISAEGNVRRRLAVGNDPAVFRLLAVELPPRSYTAIVITLLPQPRIEKRVRDAGWTELKPAGFWLRGYDLYGPGSPTPHPQRKPTS